MATQIGLGPRTIGPQCPPLFLPDIGTFFNRDTEAAKQMVRALAASGAEIIKGEILHDAGICLDDATVESYFSVSKREMLSERYRDLIERKVLSFSSYEDIFSECKKSGIPFVLSVYDFAGAEFAKDIGACALKIATSNVVHEPLIKHAAKLSLPLILDTGKSTMEEISRALRWAREGGCRDLVLEYSPPAPPAPADKQNIRVIDTFSRAFHCLVGLSDHHAGPEMLYAATVLGAAVIEKGICADANADDQDVAHALPIGRFREVHEACRAIHAGLGTGELPPVKDKKKARMGLTARQDLEAGATISLETASFAFPAVGIPVEHWSLIAGWQLRHTLPAGAPITWSDVEPVAT